MVILAGNLLCPCFCDNAAAVLITTNEKPSRKTRHIEWRWLYPRHTYACGYTNHYHVHGDQLMLADPFTKNKNSLDEDVRFKLSIMLKDPPTANASSSTGTAAGAMYTTLKRGVGANITRSICAAGSGMHAGHSQGSAQHVGESTVEGTENAEQQQEEQRVRHDDHDIDQHGALRVALGTDKVDT